MSLSKTECGRLGGRPRILTLEERQQQPHRAQENNKGGKDTPSILASNNRAELLRLYKLCCRSSNHKQIQKGTRSDLITSGPGKE